MNESVNQVRAVLAEIIKAALVSDDARSLDFRDSARSHQQALAADPPEPDSVKIDGAWTLAIQDAEAPEFREAQGQVNLTLPRASVIDLDALLAADFDVDAAVERVRKSASTG